MKALDRRLFAVPRIIELQSRKMLTALFGALSESKRAVYFRALKKSDEDGLSVKNREDRQSECKES